MRIKIKLINYNYYLTIKSNYCGAVYECKAPREGEDWLRGGDLRDGKLWKLPFVLWDILCCDFSIGRWAKTLNITVNFNS